MSSHPVVPDAGRVTVYATSWCPYCSMLRSGLAAADVPFTEIDVDADRDAAQFVMSVNGGNRVVPTVVFPDATTATNPEAEQVRRRLT